MIRVERGCEHASAAFDMTLEYAASRDFDCADALCLSVRRRISRHSTRGVTLSDWSVCGICVRSSDSDTLLIADHMNGLHELHLQSPEMQTVCENLHDQKTRSEWRVVNVLEIDSNTVLLLEWDLKGV